MADSVTDSMTFKEIMARSVVKITDAQELLSQNGNENVDKMVHSLEDFTNDLKSLWGRIFEKLKQLSGLRTQLADKSLKEGAFDNMLDNIAMGNYSLRDDSRFRF